MFTTQVTEKIRKNNYTPFEAMLYIHKFFTNKYRVDFDDFSRESVVVSNQIEKIITALCMPGLKCNTIQTLARPNEHLPIKNYFVNLISVRDPDYTVSGTFANDTIRDASSNDFENGKGFAHCLFPVSDLKQAKHIAFASLPQELSVVNNSILPPTFISALRKIFETSPELCQSEDFNEFVYREFSNSFEVAAQSFGTNATSKFAQCSKSTMFHSQNTTGNDESTI